MATATSRTQAEGEEGTDGCCYALTSWLSRWHRKINHMADRFFYRLGYRVAFRPKSTVFVALLAVFLCCLGFMNLTIEADAEDLWLPKESLSRTQEAVVFSFFDEGSDFASILLEHPDDGGSVLTKQSLDVFWDLNAKIVEIETDSGNSFEDLCVKELDGVTCAPSFRGVARFWGNSSFGAYNATVSNDADVLEAVNVAQFPDGQPVGLAAIFGNSVTYNESGAVSGARAMVQSYDVEVTSGDDDEYREVLEWQAAVQDFLALEVELAEGNSGLNLVYSTGRSLNDALEETIAGEVFLFVITYSVMSLFVTLVIGRCRRNSVERRTWLGGAGVGTVAASGLAAYGICSALGVPFTALSNLLPFILVGIGVDDMFVMSAAFDQTEPSLLVEDRMALALERCGVSITYTSLTNFSAFMLGSLSALPAVEYFCLYAATAILFDFILQVTVFSAFLTMDANRQKAGKMDFCCCFTNHTHLDERVRRGVTLANGEGGKRKEGEENGDEDEDEDKDEEEKEKEKKQEKELYDEIRQKSILDKRTDSRLSPAATAAGAAVAAAPPLLASSELGVSPRPKSWGNPLAGQGGGFSSLTTNGNGSTIAWVNPLENNNEGISGGGDNGEKTSSDVRHLTGVGRWMRDKYTPFLLSAKGKVVVFLATAGLLAWGIYGVNEVTEGFDPLDLAADGHFAREYTLVSREYALDPESQFVPLGIYTPNVDYTSATVQAIVQGTDSLMLQQPYFSGPVDSWLGAFVTWAQQTPEFSENVGTLFGYLVYQDNATFYSTLDAFLADGTNARFQSDLAFGNNGEIEMSASNLFIVNLTSTDSAVSALEDAREVVGGIRLGAFAYSPVFVFIEQYLVIYDELIATFLYALAAVAALSLLVLGKPGVVFFICMAVVMIDVELLGSVYHWGLELNAITVVELVMAVGLVVDYMVHIVHYYLKQDTGIANDLRIGRALGEIGPSVVVGAITTFLGILPLGFARNVIFRVFFKMFLVIITLGFFHGVVFIPVALSLLSGDKIKSFESSSLRRSESSGSNAGGSRSTDNPMHTRECTRQWIPRSQRTRLTREDKGATSSISGNSPTGRQSRNLPTDRRGTSPSPPFHPSPLV